MSKCTCTCNHISASDDNECNTHQQSANSSSSSSLSPATLQSPNESNFATTEVPNLIISEEEAKHIKSVAAKRAEHLVHTAHKWVNLHDKWNIDESKFIHTGVEQLLLYNQYLSRAITECDPNYFANMSKGQSPQYMYIGCSDSRVSSNELMGLFPGEVFVHRNVANVISPTDLNMLAALQYAVEHLHIRHIIVAGHLQCGGVTAAFHDTPCGLTGYWVKHVRAVKRKFAQRLKAEIHSTELQLSALCELNVLAQVRHLLDTDIIQDAWEKNRESVQTSENMVNGSDNNTANTTTIATPISPTSSNPMIDIHG